MRWFVFFALLCACGTYPPVVVRAARDLRCPEDEIETRDLGEGGFRAQGCGRMAVYDCQPTEDGSRTVCVRQ